jgi:eukaryotic-like serine/threonine-protein kinase
LATNSADGFPLNRVRPDAANVGLTVDYQPPPEQAQPPRLAVVAGSGSKATSELASLLHRRLRFLSVLFAGLLGIVTLLVLATYQDSYFLFLALRTPAFAITAVLAIVLWGRKAWTIRQLRLMEMLLFGTLIGYYLIRSHYLLSGQGTFPHAVELVSQHQEALAQRVVVGANYEVYAPWVLLIIAYGIFIPNCWPRCALVIAFMTLCPFALRTAAYVTSGMPLDNWANVVGFNGLVTFLAVSAFAIFGAHRIEVLRQEAVQARRLGQYQLLKRLGAGGMGEVYLAEHVLLRRPCALKLIRADRVGDVNNLRRFEREVQITATLTHPHTVQVFDYGHAEDGTFYYVMEYLPGLTLEQLVKDNGPLPPARAIHLLRQVCGALREAHAIGLIHRDIKPGNVMVCERGGVHDTAKLLDFGLVIPVRGSPESDRLTQEGAITGTPAYMSPEQAGGQDDLDARSDIYSLGALTYFLLTGQPPFAGRSAVKMLAAHLYEQPAPMTNRRVDMPPELEAIVLRCLAKNPADRFHDVRSLETALTECDTVKEWTDDDAAEWWQLQAGSEGRTGSNQGDAEAGRTSQCT